MIMSDSLPFVKSFFHNTQLSQHGRGFVVRLMIGFVMHWGRMSGSQAARAVRSDIRHRAQVTRFLAGSSWGNSGEDYTQLALALITMERNHRDRWLFIVDKTNCSRQGEKTENTFSTGNRKRRPKKGRRYNQKKTAPKRCHGFVMGLLITPRGCRIPFHRCYYTQAYCAEKNLDHRTESELAAAMIRILPVPEGVRVTVLGDTSYDAAVVREACNQRDFTWIVPVNPERVLASNKPRPKVSSRLLDLTARSFSPVRFIPGKGQYVAQRRVAACRIGPKAKTRTFHAHRERLQVHSVGKVQVVFSTKEKPRNGKRIERDKTKILMTNDLTLSVKEIVELYDLRWQIELFFKELKSTLGLGHYRLAKFTAVESWVECCLATFLYLEWYRAKQLTARGLSRKAKQWWARQRTHGLCQAVSQEAELKELQTLAKWSRTPTGLKKLRRCARAAHPAEYQTPP
jgi:hypothetical protein